MLCFCAQYTFLMYRLESVLFRCTVRISDVPSGKCTVSVHSTHFCYTVCIVFCFCAQYTFLIYSLEIVSVHSTHFWCTVWKVFCFCAQCVFVIYSLECFLFLCTLHISDVTSGNLFFCAQYSFLIYHPESVLILCKVHLSEVPFGRFSVPVHSTHFWCPNMWHSFN